MVLRFHSLQFNEAFIRRTLRTNAIGTPFFNIRLLEDIGLEVVYGEATSVDVLVAAIESGYPPICAVNTLGLGYWKDAVQHAVVPVEISTDQIVLNDPNFASRRQQVMLDAFLLAWADHDYQYAIIHPK